MKIHPDGSAYRIVGNASPVNGITVIKSQDVIALSFLQTMLMGDSFGDIAKRRFNGVSGSVSKITLEVDGKGCGEFAHQQPFSSSDISKDRKETNAMKAIILDM